ncbi:phage major capsid protein [Priestia megaterium]|uniref:phage major capsid protein n=1 Tax=Priestia megaterium TaxID=1404 RepID=UPI0039EB9C96
MNNQLKNSQLELRQIEVDLTGVTQESGDLLVSGYVNETGQWSQPLGRDEQFVERIMPGTFKRALDKGNDIHFLAEHDNNKLLASTKNGSLTLREDDKGLFMEARISPTSWGKDYHQLITDGLLTNMSFGMGVINDKWEKRSDGTYARSINELMLAEVSVVRNPAYVQSSIQARSLDCLSEDELFLMQKNNEDKVETIMSKEKQLKELRAMIDALANEPEVKAEVEEIRAVEPELNSKELETRAVEQFLRKKVGEELRAVTGGTGVGQMTVPTHISDLIVEKLYEVAPLFARTKNFTPVNGSLEILREQANGGSSAVSWVGEMEDISKADFTMDKVELTQKRAGTAIEISQQLVNDSGIDIINYVVGLLAKRLGLMLDRQILNGAANKNGATVVEKKQFEGILNSVAVENITSASTTEITMDELLDVYNALHPQLLEGAVWVVSRLTFNKIAKLKDGNGNYHLVRDVPKDGVAYRLFGCPVFISDAMTDSIAGYRSVLFGNFEAGYATMTKKGLALQHISGDTTQALRGSHLIMIDAYMDGKIYNENAFKFLIQKSA